MQNQVLGSLEYIFETIPALGFVEVMGCVGGDIVTYRAYDDGSIYQR